MSKNPYEKRPLHVVPIDNFVKKALPIIARLRLKPGSVVAWSTYHDDWCGFLRGRRCNCDPGLVPRVLNDDPR